MNIISNGFNKISNSDFEYMINFLEKKVKTKVLESFEIIYGVFSNKINYLVAFEVSKKLGVAFCPLPYTNNISTEVARVNKIGVQSVLLLDDFNYHIIQGKRQNIPKLNNFCLCFLTSGSSGKRKLIALSKENIDAAVLGIQERLNYRQSDIVANVLPQSFDYGFYQYLLAKKADCTLLLFDEGYSIESLKSMCKLGVTVLPGVPSMLASMASIADRVMKSNDIRLITSTGEALSGGLLVKLEKLFPKADIASMYGLTECKRVAIHPTSQGRGRGSVGKPIQHCLVRIDSADEHGIGEIVVEGPNVAQCIFELGDSGLIIKSFDEQTLYTGDYGYLDEHGFLHVCGRKDDLVKISGMRHSLKEIEDHLYNTNRFDVVKVVAIDRIIMVMCSQSILKEKEVKQLLIEKFGVHMSSVKVKVVDELRLTDNLKLDQVDEL
ncbi:AMP-binding protein [Photorhabdus laumondii]